MKFMKLLKDGGPLSKVWGYFLIEIKLLFSIVLLNFKDGSREAYHSHAFSSYFWVLKGHLTEQVLNEGTNIYRPELKPRFIGRDRFHKVTSKGDSWILNFRGPWADTWQEFDEKTKEYHVLTHGRKVVG